MTRDPAPQEVTELLDAWSAGDPRAVDRLMPLGLGGFTSGFTYTNWSGYFIDKEARRPSGTSWPRTWSSESW